MSVSLTSAACLYCTGFRLIRSGRFLLAEMKEIKVREGVGERYDSRNESTRSTPVISKRLWDRNELGRVADKKRTPSIL